MRLYGYKEGHKKRYIAELYVDDGKFKLHGISIDDKKPLEHIDKIEFYNGTAPYHPTLIIPTIQSSTLQKKTDTQYYLESKIECIFHKEGFIKFNAVLTSENPVPQIELQGQWGVSGHLKKRFENHSNNKSQLDLSSIPPFDLSKLSEFIKDPSLNGYFQYYNELTDPFPVNFPHKYHTKSSGDCTILNQALSNELHEATTKASLPDIILSPSSIIAKNNKGEPYLTYLWSFQFEIISGTFSPDAYLGHLLSNRPYLVTQRIDHRWLMQTNEHPGDQKWLVELSPNPNQHTNKDDYDGLSRFWNAYIADPYLEGLRRVKAGQAFSILPRIEKVLVPSWKITYHFPYQLSEGSYHISEPLSICAIGVSDNTSGVAMDLVFPCFLTQNNEPLRWSVKAFSNEYPELDGSTLIFKELITTIPFRCRFGAFDLDFHNKFTDPSDQYISFCKISFIEKSSKIKPNTPISMKLSFSFPLVDFHPGGQDDLPSDQYGNAGSTTITDKEFCRSQALVISIDNPRKPSSADFILQANESTDLQASQKIEVFINTTGNKIDFTSKKAIILDRHPFLISKVEIPNYYAQDITQVTTEIASWSNTLPEGAGWQFHSRSKGFNLYLPPQALGEEMERGKDISEGESLKYQLSPPMRAKILPSYFTQRYVEPPWNLRRILGYSGQREAGAKILNMQFELLYGLTCHIETKDLRLAEISSSLGIIQGPLGEPPDYFPEWLKEKFKNYAKKWSEYYQELLARPAIIEVKDETKEGILTIEDGVSFELRSIANLSYPIKGKKPKYPYTPEGLLQGSYAWAFENKFDYDSLWQFLPRLPKSSHGKLMNVFFSALGGWGNQKAVFMDGQITIISTTEMGRATTISLELVGRASTLWNHNKRVITYERVVLPTNQFSGEQDRLADLPILRKVSDNLAVTQAIRKFPENSQGNDKVTEFEVARGFVLGCEFKTLIIPIDSRWTKVLGENDFIIPLWHGIDNDPNYPKPHICLEVATDPETGRLSELREIEDPQKLYFYWCYGQGANPDLWPPVSGVDYPNVPIPIEVSKNAFEDGYWTHTYSLKSTPRGVNLTHARTQKPLGAVLRNVTMMRSYPSASLSKQNINSPFNLLGQLMSLVELMLVSACSSSDISEALQELRNELNHSTLIKNIEDTTKAIKEDIEKIPDPLEKLNSIITNKFRSERENIAHKLYQFRDKLYYSFNKLLSSISEFSIDDQELKNLVLRIINFEFDGLEDGLFVANGWTYFLKRNISHCIKSLEDNKPDIIEIIQNLLNNLDKGIPVNQTEFSGELLTARFQYSKLLNNELSKSFRTFPYRLLTEALISRIYNDIKSDEKKYLTDFKTVLDSLAANSLPKEFKEELISLKQSTIQLSKTITNSLNNLSNETDSILKGNSIQLDSRMELRNVLIKLVPTTPTQDLLKILITTIDTYKWDIDTLHFEVSKEFEQKLLDRLTQFNDKLFSQKIFSSIPDLIFESIESDTIDLFGTLDEKRIKDVRLLKDLLIALQQSLSSRVSGYCYIFTDILFEHQKEVVLKASDKTLRLIRAYGSPPRVPSLEFDTKHMAYLFEKDKLPVKTSETLALVNQLHQDLSSLNPIGIQIPSNSILDEIIPNYNKLKDMAFSQVFSDIAGLKLNKLFPSLPMPDLNNNNIKISQQFDIQTQRAALDLHINLPLSNDPVTVFSASPVILSLSNPILEASMHMETSLDGDILRKTTGALSGTWEVQIGELNLVTFNNTTLSLDSSGNMHFEISPENIRLSTILQFISNYLVSNKQNGSGLTTSFITSPYPQALTQINLPLPSIKVPGFTLEHLQFGCMFALGLGPDSESSSTPEFLLDLALNLGSKNAPFAITILMLGGGGWIETNLHYSNKPITTVSIGIAAKATIGVTIGNIIDGGVSIALGIYVEYNSNNSQSLVIGIILIISGHVCLLGIVEAGINLILEACYTASTGLKARGVLNLEIKICWCFTLEIHRAVEYEPNAKPSSLMTNAFNGTENPYYHFASDYIDMMQ